MHHTGQGGTDLILGGPAEQACLNEDLNLVHLPHVTTQYMRGIDLIHAVHHLTIPYMQGTDLIHCYPHPTTQYKQGTDLIHRKPHIATQYMQGAGLI